MQQNLDESMKSFRKSQKLRQFIDDTNGPLECRDGSLGCKERELQPNVGPYSRLRGPTTTENCGGLGRRSSCFAIGDQEAEKKLTIERIRRSIDRDRQHTTDLLDSFLSQANNPHADTIIDIHKLRLSKINKLELDDAELNGFDEYQNTVNMSPETKLHTHKVSEKAAVFNDYTDE